MKDNKMLLHAYPINEMYQSQPYAGIDQKEHAHSKINPKFVK